MFDHDSNHEMTPEGFAEIMRGAKFRTMTWRSIITTAKRGAPEHVKTAHIVKTTTGTVRGGLNYAHLRGPATCGCQPLAPTAPWATEADAARWGSTMTAEALHKFVQVAKDGAPLGRIYRGRGAYAVTTWTINGENVTANAAETLCPYLTDTEWKRHFAPKPSERTCPTCGAVTPLATLTFTVRLENLTPGAPRTAEM